MIAQEWDSWPSVSKCCSLGGLPCGSPRHGWALAWHRGPMCWAVSDVTSSLSERADLERENVGRMCLFEFEPTQQYLQLRKKDISLNKILGEWANYKRMSKSIHIEHVVFLICQRRRLDPIFLRSRLAINSVLEKSKWDHNIHRYLQTLRGRGSIRAEEKRVRGGLGQWLQISKYVMFPRLPRLGAWKLI